MQTFQLERKIPLSNLEQGFWQIRETTEDAGVAQLAESIESIGLLNSIHVRPSKTKKGHYEIIHGVHRWKAHQLLVQQGKRKFTEIPCIIEPLDDFEASIASATENLARQNLTAYELRKLAKMISTVNTERVTQEELAKRLGISRTYFVNLLRAQETSDLLKLPKRTAQALPTRVLLAIRQVPNDRQKLELIESVIKKRLSADNVEKMVGFLTKDTVSSEQNGVDESLSLTQTTNNGIFGFQQSLNTWTFILGEMQRLARRHPEHIPDLRKIVQMSMNREKLFLEELESANDDIMLEECSRTNPTYLRIRNLHYVPNKGAIGRQIHYLIRMKNHSEPIGVISGNSAMFSCKPINEFFGITNENRSRIQNIINNDVFKLEHNEPNLASRILALWRKRVVKDWESRYQSKVIGYETFIDSVDDRTNTKHNGVCYRADGFTFVGITKGSAKSHERGAYVSKMIRKPTTNKLIFCRFV